jgi:hypothetical protein
LGELVVVLVEKVEISRKRTNGPLRGSSEHDDCHLGYAQESPTNSAIAKYKTQETTTYSASTSMPSIHEVSERVTTSGHQAIPVEQKLDS